MSHSSDPGYGAEPFRSLCAKYPLVPALVRYVECKCLLGGVTTSQGIELYSNAGARRYYR